MVFMKGNPDAPRCGFSRTLVGLLREEGMTFETFDILEDQEIRQGLKDISNWPTYPQVKLRVFPKYGMDKVGQVCPSTNITVLHAKV